MAALTPTAANVTIKNDKALTNGPAGEALSQGEVVFLNTGDSKWYALNVSDGSMVGKTVGICLCICDAVDERAVVAATEDSIIDLGTTVTEGTWYVASGSDGVLEEYSDLTAGENVTFIGYGDENDNLVLNVNTQGYTK